MTPHEEKVRAEDAKQLLANPMYSALMREMDIKILEKLGELDMPPDKAARLQMFFAVKKMYDRALHNAIMTGKLVIEEERRRSLVQRALDRIPR